MVLWLKQWELWLKNKSCDKKHRNVNDISTFEYSVIKADNQITNVEFIN